VDERSFSSHIFVLLKGKLSLLGDATVCSTCSFTQLEITYLLFLSVLALYETVDGRVHPIQHSSCYSPTLLSSSPRSNLIHSVSCIVRPIASTNVLTSAHVGMPSSQRPTAEDTKPREQQQSPHQTTRTLYGTPMATRNNNINNNCTVCDQE
jgi:hypothetical protein